MMKTAEEKVREASNDYGIDDIQHRTMFASGYLQGYSEAMRWRDPEEELPEEGVNVFVKMIRSGEYGEETIYVSSHVVNDFYHDSESNTFGCEWYYPAGNGGRVRVTVIGWRPIE